MTRGERCPCGVGGGGVIGALPRANDATGMPIAGVCRKFGGAPPLPVPLGTDTCGTMKGVGRRTLPPAGGTTTAARGTGTAGEAGMAPRVAAGICPEGLSWTRRPVVGHTRARGSCLSPQCLHLPSATAVVRSVIPLRAATAKCAAVRGVPGDNFGRTPGASVGRSARRSPSSAEPTVCPDPRPTTVPRGPPDNPPNGAVISSSPRSPHPLRRSPIFKSLPRSSRRGWRRLVETGRQGGRDPIARAHQGSPPRAPKPC
jgi:hypothetical protein